MSKEENVIWVTCASWGNQNRKHKVLHEKVIHYVEERDGPPLYDMFHRLVECMGCETVKYVTSTLDTQAKAYGEDVDEEDFKVYPDAPGRASSRRLATISNQDSTDDEVNSLIPEAVRKMYRETMDAFNANGRTLAGVGWRAVFEAICICMKINAR